MLPSDTVNTSLYRFLFRVSGDKRTVAQLPKLDCGGEPALKSTYTFVFLDSVSLLERLQVSCLPRLCSHAAIGMLPSLTSLRLLWIMQQGACDIIMVREYIGLCFGVTVLHHGSLHSRLHSRPPICELMATFYSKEE